MRAQKGMGMWMWRGRGRGKGQPDKWCSHILELPAIEIIKRYALSVSLPLHSRRGLSLPLINETLKGNTLPFCCCCRCRCRCEAFVCGCRSGCAQLERPQNFQISDLFNIHKCVCVRQHVCVCVCVREKFGVLLVSLRCGVGVAGGGEDNDDAAGHNNKSHL